jgi:hypothetical protein
MSEAPSSMTPVLCAGSQEGDSVAAINPADLRNVWKFFRDAQARNLAVELDMKWRNRRGYILAALIFMVGVVIGAVAMLKITR